MAVIADSSEPDIDLICLYVVLTIQAVIPTHFKLLHHLGTRWPQGTDISLALYHGSPSSFHIEHFPPISSRIKVKVLLYDLQNLLAFYSPFKIDMHYFTMPQSYRHLWLSNTRSSVAVIFTTLLSQDNDVRAGERISQCLYSFYDAAMLKMRCYTRMFLHCLIHFGTRFAKTEGYHMLLSATPPNTSTISGYLALT